MRFRLLTLTTAPAFVLLACNGLTGAHDRFLDDTEPSIEDSGVTTKMKDSAVDVTDAGLEAAVEPDANLVTTVNVPNNWTTVNDAGFQIVENGVKITSAGAGASHPIIVPLPTPSVPTSNYTVVATILATQDSEFGIVTRMRTNGAGVLFGSKIGVPTVPAPFIGTVGPTSWNPNAGQRGPSYTFVSKTHYKMKLVAQDEFVTGKMWAEDEAEPAGGATIEDKSAPADRGRNVGFYIYSAPRDVTLLDMTITFVP